jgi:hypothetical protein
LVSAVGLDRLDDAEEGHRQVHSLDRRHHVCLTDNLLANKNLLRRT